MKNDDNNETNRVCRKHSGIVARVRRLEVDVEKHERELDEGQRKFADFSGDMRVIKILLGLMILIVLGGTFGPKVLTLFGW